MLWIAILVVVALGYANQHGSTCAVAAADEIVTARSFYRVAGFGLAGAVSAALLFALGCAPRVAATAGLGSIAGGAIGAIGAALNGRCTMGTIASLGRGRIDRLATLAGFFVGAWLVLRQIGWSAPQAVVTPHASLPLAALSVVVAAGAWLLARNHGAAKPGWMALIGLLNAVLLWGMIDWSYTGGLTKLAAGSIIDVAGFLGFLVALVGGSVLAAVLAGTVHVRGSAPREWLQSGLGGLLLGAGSALVPGSNDAMLLVGVPLLVPGLLLAYATFWVTLLVLRGLHHHAAEKDAIGA